jgi:CHASE3 domain sensor protein
MLDLVIAKRLNSSFGLILVFFIGMVSGGIWGIIQMSQITESINNEYKTVEHSQYLLSNVIQLRRFEKDIFLNIESPEHVAEYKKKYDEIVVRYNKNIEDLMKRTSGQREQKLTLEIKKNSTIYLNGFYSVYEKIKHGEATDSAEANRQMETFKLATHQTEKLADELANDHLLLVAALLGKASIVKKNGITALAVLLTLSLSSGILIYFSTMRFITQSHQTIVEQRDQLARQKAELEATLVQIKQLEGIIPICSYCKKIRDHENSWNQLERYISEHSDAIFSHGICPDCYEKQMAALDNMDSTSA